MQPAATLSIFRAEDRYFFHLAEPFVDTRIRGNSLYPPIGIFASQRPAAATINQIEEAIADASERMLAATRQRRTTSDAVDEPLRRLGRVLHDLLLPSAVQQRIASLPSHIPLLLITNDQWLSWELLHDGHNYLAHHRPLARHLLTQDGASQRTPPYKPQSVLLISNPTANLPQASMESEHLLDLFDAAATERIDAKCLAGSQATRASVLQHLGDDRYDVIHYSGHASPTALHLFDGELTADEIRSVLRGQPFIFLNGCSTGAHTDVAPGAPLTTTGLEIHNLAAAFLLGGAAGVLSTSRPIFDASSRSFAERFYSMALDGVAIGEIVRRARQHLYRQDADDPLWASYVYYGDPGLRIAGLERQELCTVTLLAARISGIWQLYESLSLERAASRESDLIERLTQTAQDFGGQVVGSRTGLLDARFGMLQAREDDAERAVRAAFEMLYVVQGFNQTQAEYLAQPITVGIGISTGKTLSKQVATTAGVDHQLAGDIIDQAAALAAGAGAGQILVDETTYRLIERDFSFIAQGNITLTESDRSLAAYNVLKVPPTNSSVELMIGRQEELSRLQRWWQEAVSGQGRLVEISGSAGIGKSRLIQELHRQLAGSECQWLHAECQSYDADRSYALLAQLVRQLAEIAPEDTVSQRQAKLYALIQEIVGNTGPRTAEQIEQGVAFLGQTVGVHLSLPLIDNLEPELRQENLARVFRAVLTHKSAKRTIVLALEDMQWVDSASLAVLDQLARTLGRMRLLLLISYRDEWSHPWSALDYFHRIRLSDLDDDGCRALLAHLLRVETVPDSLATPIVQHTRGNPFYIEEVLRSLQESGDLARTERGWMLTRDLTAAPLSDRIESIIQDRIHRLDEASREVLQAASVIGQTFEQQVLAGVQAEAEREQLGRRLAKLIQRNFIWELPGWLTVEYSFSHGFIHQAAYGSLLERLRRSLHRLVARALIRLFGGDEIARIAYHFYQSDDRVQTIRYCLLAARNAADAWDNGSAIRWYDRALEKIESFDQEPASIEEIEAGASADQLLLWQIEALEGKADAQSTTGGNDEAIENYGSVLILASGLDDFPLTRQAAIQGKIAIAHQNKGDFSQARAALEQGLGILNEWQSPELGRLHVWLGLLAYRQGIGLAEGLASCERGIDVLERAESVQDLAQAYNLQGLLLHELGSSEKAIVAHERSAALYKEVSYLPGTERAYSNLGCVYQDLGRWEEALQAFEGAASLADKTGESWRQSAASINLGEIYRRQGRLKKAVASYETARQVADTYGFDELRGLAAMNLGAVYLRQKQLAQALSHLQESVEIFRDAEAGRNLIEARRWLAEAYGEEGRLDEAVALVQEALHQATEQEVQIEIGHGQRVLGKLHRLQGELGRAQEELEQALANFEEHHNLHETALSLLERALLFEARYNVSGDGQMLQQALADCESALGRFTQLGAQLDAQDARGIAERLRARLQG